MEKLIFLDALISVIVGALGSRRICGFAGPFLISLILTPAVGIFIILASPTVEEAKKLERQRQFSVLKRFEVSKELERLQQLRETGVLTVQEFEVQKLKLFNHLPNNTPTARHLQRSAVGDSLAPVCQRGN